MPQPVQIGWIDLGSRDKNKILSVLSLLYAAEAVDELGIGVIRDGFADVLFPGTSTVQTRAKYFLIVPFILMELERERNLTPRALLDRLAKEEIALISQLKETRRRNQWTLGKGFRKTLQYLLEWSLHLRHLPQHSKVITG